MSLDLKELKNNLTIEDIFQILKSLRPNLNYIDQGDKAIFPTICHNKDPVSASMKLYYYQNTHLFHCWTGCNESFDIYELIKKILILDDLKPDDSLVLSIVLQNVDLNLSILGKNQNNNLNLEKFKKKNFEYDFDKINPKILNYFSNLKPKVWLDEGISLEAMDSFQIKTYPSKEQIIIPHFDYMGNLIGIRSRNLNPINLQYGKYMPTKVGNKFYAHPLSYNLYGLNINYYSIKKAKTALIFESEKSVLKMYDYYKFNSLAVAVCGNKISRAQINLLLNMKVTNAIICFDRMNDSLETNDSYFNYLANIINKYQNYINFSFVFDREKLIKYKDAPVDNGKEIFEKLLQRRIKI